MVTVLEIVLDTGVELIVRFVSNTGQVNSVKHTSALMDILAKIVKHHVIA